MDLNLGPTHAYSHMNTYSPMHGPTQSMRANHTCKMEKKKLNKKLKVGVEMAPKHVQELRVTSVSLGFVFSILPQVDP